MQAEPKTRRGRETRERIVERTADLIVERGIERTGLDDVLRAADASKGQLYHYFADRDELIEAAVALRCDQVAAELEALFGRLDSLDELETNLSRFAGIYEQTLSGCPVGTLAVQVAGRNRAAEEHLRLAFDTWQQLFTDLFTRLRDRGTLRAEANPATLGLALLSALEGGQVLSQSRGDAQSLRIALATTLEYIRSFTT
jgi:TetR/AcrR family transcriptional repressor of nem operon